VGTLIETNQNARELLTEILDKMSWWSTLDLIVDFLRSKRVDRVRIEFGFVLDRELEGRPQAPGQIVQLDDLETVIKKGFDEETIEWAKASDFRFYPLGIDLAFMLCNDADLHFASTDSSLLMELGHKIYSSGIKVCDSGQLINLL
jgi:hypothetical protein